MEKYLNIFCIAQIVFDLIVIVFACRKVKWGEILVYYPTITRHKWKFTDRYELWWQKRPTGGGWAHGTRLFCINKETMGKVIAFIGGFFCVLIFFALIFLAATW